MDSSVIVRICSRPVVFSWHIWVVFRPNTTHVLIPTRWYARIGHNSIKWVVVIPKLSRVFEICGGGSIVSPYPFVWGDEARRRACCQLRSGVLAHYQIITGKIYRFSKSRERVSDICELQQRLSRACRDEDQVAGERAPSRHSASVGGKKL